MQPAKIKVLLAEDDLVLGYVIKDNLEIGGYDVTLCPDGDEALQQFQKQEFDICLLDVMMRPPKDGFTSGQERSGVKATWCPFYSSPPKPWRRTK